MGMGPVAAINDAMRRCDVQLKDMDLVELNEAFAAQSLGVELKPEVIRLGNGDLLDYYRIAYGKRSNRE